MLFLFEGIGFALLLALILDGLFGDPGWLYRRLPHPAALMGKALTSLERCSYDEGVTSLALFRRGGLMTAALAVACLVMGLVLQWACLQLPYGWAWLGVLMSPLIAQKSLADHVAAVGDGLEKGLDEGREAVRHIVGRDPDALDEHGVARAAVESLAENFSDGVTAPIFWGVLFGLPGMLAYKMINTADSMIGYKNERYRHFGRFAARLDDVVNWLPARLSGVLILLAAGLRPGARMQPALDAMLRDAPNHRSPNAGWPEAAMAGALGLRLAGPRSYHGKPIDGAWMGDGHAELTPADIRASVTLFWWACGLLLPLVLIAIAAVRL